MKATKKIIAVLVCAFALCFALVGCDSGAEQYKKNFQGGHRIFYHQLPQFFRVRHAQHHPAACGSGLP